MNIYNYIFITFYYFRKGIRSDNNEIAAVSFVSLMQGLQIASILMILACFGFPDFMAKYLPEVAGAGFVLHLFNQFYFFSSKKTHALIEADNLLTEAERNKNRRFSMIVITLTIIGVFVIASIGHSLLHSKN